MDGPNDTAVSCHRFSPDHTLLYHLARAVRDALWGRQRATESSKPVGDGMHVIDTEPLSATTGPPQHPSARQGLDTLRG